MKKINDISKSSKYPIIAKQVGEGLDIVTAKALSVDAYDVGGWGGTNWNLVESYRRSRSNDLGVLFSQVGRPTAECIASISKLGKPVIGSGGVRSGIDAAKGLALGASVMGMALPFLQAQQASGKKGIRTYLDSIISELKVSMYCMGAKKVSELKGRIDYG